MHRPYWRKQRKRSKSADVIKVFRNRIKYGKYICADHKWREDRVMSIRQEFGGQPVSYRELWPLEVPLLTFKNFLEKFQKRC